MKKNIMEAIINGIIAKDADSKRVHDALNSIHIDLRGEANKELSFFVTFLIDQLAQKAVDQIFDTLKVLIPDMDEESTKDFFISVVTPVIEEPIIKSADEVLARKNARISSFENAIEKAAMEAINTGAASYSTVLKRFRKNTNMYPFVTGSWNPLKGWCSHGCSYCFVRNMGIVRMLRLDETEFQRDLGEGETIFICSGTDMMAKSVPSEDIERIIAYAEQFDNKYLIQTKNPERLKDFKFSDKFIFCTTAETNRFYKSIMGNTVTPVERVLVLPKNNIVTIEPILDFDLDQFVEIIKTCEPKQVIIGADTQNQSLVASNRVCPVRKVFN